MSLSHHHGCCQYHKSLPIPWVHAYNISPCLYHESLSNPCFHFHTMRNTVFIYTEIQISWIKKFKFHNYRNTTFRFTEIQSTVIQKYKILNCVQKYKWKDYRNTSDFWIMGDFWRSPCLYHESLWNPCFHVYTIRKKSCQIYRKTNNKNK